MEIIHQIFDWRGIPSLFLLYWTLFILESKFELRLRNQHQWNRTIVNNLLSVPSFILLRFLLLPALIYISILDHRVHFGINYWIVVPEWLRYFLTFLLLDYGNYLWHLLNHKIPILWRFHLVHHCDKELDLTTALRFHFGEILGSVLFRGAFVGLLGASPVMILWYEIIFEAEVLFHHSNIRMPLKVERILNFLVVTPRMHAIHHSRNPEETQSNFSSVLSIWDRLHHTDRMKYARENPTIGAPFFINESPLNLGQLFRLPFQGDIPTPNQPTRMKNDPNWGK